MLRGVTHQIRVNPYVEGVTHQIRVNPYVEGCDSLVIEVTLITVAPPLGASANMEDSESTEEGEVLTSSPARNSEQPPISTPMKKKEKKEKKTKRKAKRQSKCKLL